MESNNTHSEQVSVTPFLPKQITTKGLIDSGGGVGVVLAAAAGLGGMPLLHLLHVFAQTIDRCDMGLSNSSKWFVALQSLAWYIFS